MESKVEAVSVYKDTSGLFTTQPVRKKIDFPPIWCENLMPHSSLRRTSLPLPLPPLARPHPAPPPRYRLRPHPPRWRTRTLCSTATHPSQSSNNRSRHHNSSSSSSSTTVLKSLPGAATFVGWILPFGRRCSSPTAPWRFSPSRTLWSGFTSGTSRWRWTCWPTWLPLSRPWTLP